MKKRLYFHVYSLFISSPTQILPPRATLRKSPAPERRHGRPAPARTHPGKHSLETSDTRKITSPAETAAWMAEQETPGLCFRRYKANVQTEGFDVSGLEAGDELAAGEVGETVPFHAFIFYENRLRDLLPRPALLRKSPESRYPSAHSFTSSR